MAEETIRQELVNYSQRAYFRGLVGGTGGNFSARIDEKRMLITASGLSLGDTNMDNLITLDVHSYQWEHVEGFTPSKEFHFHADILRLRPDIGAVLHMHSPYATAFAVNKREIPMVTDAAFKQPSMPKVPFAPSGSADLQNHVRQAIESNPGCKVLLLEQHGIVCLGIDVRSAYDIADLTEELAKIAYLAQGL